MGPTDPAAHASLSAWAACDDGFECATLTVPRRWDDVDGASLDLAVVRQRATGDRLGSLVLNPGGPGASGVDFLEGFVDGGLPAGLDERFDVVSWDPRGTGRSERIDCTSDAEWLEPEVDPTPEDQADVDAIRAEAEADTAACTEAVGDLLEVVGTRATVRDLDALRGALGDELLSYVGYSYGTTIGMEYLRLYPGRVRAMVLDGVAVPGADPVTDTLAQAAGFERTLDAYLAGCGDREGCTLGADPKATLLGLVDRLEAGPHPRRLHPRRTRRHDPRRHPGRGRAVRGRRLRPLQPVGLAGARPGPGRGAGPRPHRAHAAGPPRRLPRPPARRHLGRRRRCPGGHPLRRPGGPRRRARGRPVARGPVVGPAALLGGLVRGGRARLLGPAPGRGAPGPPRPRLARGCSARRRHRHHQRPGHALRAVRAGRGDHRRIRPGHLRRRPAHDLQLPERLHRRARDRLPRRRRGAGRRPALRRAEPRRPRRPRISPAGRRGAAGRPSPRRPCSPSSA